MVLAHQVSQKLLVKYFDLTSNPGTADTSASQVHELIPNARNNDAIDNEQARDIRQPTSKPNEQGKLNCRSMDNF